MLLFVPLTALLNRRWLALVTVVLALAVAELGLVGLGQPPAWAIGPYQGNGLPFVTQTGPRHPPPASLGALCSRLSGDPGGCTKVEGGSDATSILRLPPRALATRLAVGFTITVLGPRPSLNDIIHPSVSTGLYPGVLVWVVLIPFALLGMWRAAVSRNPTVILLALLAAAMWIGLSFAYAGVFRQRELAFPATLIFVASGLQRPWPRRWTLAYVTFLVVGFGVLAAREIYTHLA
jgi:hypothetical protein